MRDLEATWATAPLEGDLKTVSRVVADDWICTTPTGETMTKAELLDMLALPPKIFKQAHYKDITVSIFGNTAITTSQFYGKGQDLELSQRFMRVYAKREGHWQCVATQIIPAL